MRSNRNNKRPATTLKGDDAGRKRRAVAEGSQKSVDDPPSHNPSSSRPRNQGGIATPNQSAKRVSNRRAANTSTSEVIEISDSDSEPHRKAPSSSRGRAALASGGVIEIDDSSGDERPTSRKPDSRATRRRRILTPAPDEGKGKERAGSKGHDSEGRRPADRSGDVQLPRHQLERWAAELGPKIDELKTATEAALSLFSEIHARVGVSEG